MTAIAFLVFNRPEHTERAFARIRQLRPEQLFIIADGPRANHPDDVENCRLVRELVDKGIDWRCNVMREYATHNLGCGRRVSSGITWLFENVEEAIIVEDDCLLDPTFFPFCTELLERFKHDERIMLISAGNFQFGRKERQFSYYFSRYPHIWGWATWRRAWRKYDFAMSAWPYVRDAGLLKAILPEAGALTKWHALFQRVYDGEIDTWDHQWTFACWQNNGLAIVPEKNLVSNIGFDAAATHTRNASTVAEMPVTPMTFPLRHPPYVMRDYEADAFVDRSNGRGPIAARIRSRMAHGLKGMLGALHKR